MKRRIEQVSGDHGAAVGRRVHEAFRIVPRGVQSDGKPQAAGASHGETKEEPDQTSRQSADPCFARIDKVDGAKERGKQHGRGPESDAGRERVERVPAKEELFTEPHEQKGQRPENGVGGQFASTEGKRPKRKALGRAHHEQQRAQRQESPSGAAPELDPESAPSR